MKKSIVGSFAAVAALALLAACNGNNSNPSNYTPCTPPGTLVMIYPADGATGVPDSTETVYVASSASLSNPAYDSVVQTPSGYNTFGGPFTQVQLSVIPKPRATPGFANPIYYSTYIGALAPSSTWGVGFNNQNNQNCLPSEIGTFTTK